MLKANFTNIRRPILWLIGLVALCHALVIASIGFSWKSSPQLSKKNQKVLIQTISLNHQPHPIEPLPILAELQEMAPVLPQETPPEKAAPINEVEKTEKAPPPPLPKKIIPEKKVEKKAEKPSPKEVKTAPPPKPQQKSPPKSPPKKDPAEVARLEQLLKDAQESLAMVDKRVPPAAEKSLALPKNINSLKIDSPRLSEKLDSSRELSSGDINSQEQFYQEELIQTLKSFLQLPEYGDVKVRLSINRDGTLASIQVMRSESEKNRQYLEKKLKTLKFPNFGNNFKSEKQRSFVITLSNEI